MNRDSFRDPSTRRRGRRSLMAVGAIVFGLQSVMMNAASAAAPATAPSAVEYDSGPDSGSAAVSGTSSLHDWTVKGGMLTGKLLAGGQWNPGATANVQIQSIDLTIPVNSLKSTEGGGMDNTMYDALKMKADPLITFVLIRADLKSPPSKDDPASHYNAVGQLTIAGAAHPVNLVLDLTPAGGGALTIATQVQLKMSEFGMAPPTALFGTIRSGDQVTVKVIWKLAMKAH